MFELRKKIFSAAVVLCFLIIPALTNAAASTAPTTPSGLIPCATSANPRPCTLCDFIVGFKGLVDFGMKLITIAAIVGIFCAGVMYVISTGDETMMGNAKSFLKASLMGFAFVFLAWLIVSITMLVLGARPDLGIKITNWYTFSCSTVSTSGQTSTNSK